MACSSPLIAFQTDSGEIVFVERGKIRRELKLPCGQCTLCLLERSRQWAVRCMHESQMHASSCFITLTYDENHVPSDYSLVYSHFQKFMKRVRKRFSARVRFYMCGEYGESNFRPHFHALLFGISFDDRYPWRVSPSGFQLYRSSVLESLWTFGSCEIGDVSFESAAYIARYCIKTLSRQGIEWLLDGETGELYERPREFTRMSLKPGIGQDWFKKFCREVYPLDRVVVRGMEQKPPKYYDKLLKAAPDLLWDDVEFARQKRADMLREDSSPDRLEAREVVARARLKSKVRDL